MRAWHLLQIIGSGGALAWLIGNDLSLATYGTFVFAIALLGLLSIIAGRLP